MNFAHRAPEADDFLAPYQREIPDHRDVIKGELAQHGEWLVASITTNSSWPIEAQKVNWRGVDFWIMPVMKDFYPAVALRVPAGKSRAECEVLVMRFISMLSWVKESGYIVEGGGCSGGNLPRPMGRENQRSYMLSDEFDLSYFPEVADEKAALALALMREGRALNHVGYAFLSFYKVLETAFPRDNQRIAWIARSIATISGIDVKDALQKLKTQGLLTADAIGEHLFKSGRCAMAHGARKPIIDPDIPGDLRRLGSELPIVRALATKAIEDVFGVETSTTNYRKHLYELHGFKEILGPEIVGGLMDGTLSPDGDKVVNIPDISVRIRRKDIYGPLEGLRCNQIGCTGKQVYLQFGSLQGDVGFRFALDFEKERLIFDLFNDYRVRDSGSAEAAERLYEMRRFEQDYFGNGQLQIFNTDTGELIGRKDSYIPLNMYLDGRRAKAELEYWKAEARRRREQAQRFWDAMTAHQTGYKVTIVSKPAGGDLR